MARRRKRGEHAPDPDRPKKVDTKLTNNALASLADLKAPKRKKKPKPKPQPKKKAPPVPAAALPPVRRAAPLEGYAQADKRAFELAFAGVRPLGEGGVDRKKPVERERLVKRVIERAEQAEAAARARLDALVAGGVHFQVHVHEDGGVEGKRRGASDRTARMLAAGELAPVAHLDLHGERVKAVAGAVRAFVRGSHRNARRNLCIVHGKGTHSEGGRGVLQDAVIEALTNGGAAPLVDAFASAPRRFGGHGALLVRLRDTPG